MRCALEGLFNLGACARDYKTALAFVDTEKADKKRLAKHLSDVGNADAWAKLGEEARRDVLKFAKMEIDAPDVLPKVRGLAKLADMEDLYLAGYSQLSGAVHSSVRDLDQHFAADGAGQISALVVEPVLDGLDLLFVILGETMVSLLRESAKVFPLSTVDECEIRLAALQSLVPKLSAS